MDVRFIMKRLWKFILWLLLVTWRKSCRRVATFRGIVDLLKVKSNVVPVLKAYGGADVKIYIFLTSAPAGDLLNPCVILGFWFQLPVYRVLELMEHFRASIGPQLPAAAFTLKITTVMYIETLQQLQCTTQLNLENRNYTVDRGREALRTRILALFSVLNMETLCSTVTLGAICQKIRCYT
jgi:hypothetical protein